MYVEITDNLSVWLGGTAALALAHKGGKSFSPLSADPETGALLVSVVGGGGGGGAVETVTQTVATESGSVAAGAVSVTFATSDDFEGTVAGGALDADTSWSYRAQPGNTIGEIEYTITAGSLTIIKGVLAE